MTDNSILISTMKVLACLNSSLFFTVDSVIRIALAVENFSSCSIVDAGVAQSYAISVLITLDVSLSLSLEKLIEIHKVTRKCQL